MNNQLKAYGLVIFFTLQIAAYSCLAGTPASAASFFPDQNYLRDREALDSLQRDAFLYMWEDCDPATGMAYEASFRWDVRPLAVGGTGFGVAAIVVAVDREWISREQAVMRVLKIAEFLRDKPPRARMHGAFPHWLRGSEGEVWKFDDGDTGADIVETSLLMQGLLIARAYFNGPGVEKELRDVITGLWEDVDWNWFTNGEEKGLYWLWSKDHGFDPELKILGYNECLITYVLAASSPTHPISRKAYDFWTSGDKYQPANVYGYRVEASQPGGGPLFLTHYSFVGLDPHRIADAFVTRGYFVRNTGQTLGNRAYCLQEAPSQNRYGEDFWGLTASQIKGGYAVAAPLSDNGTVAPTAALSSMPYTPHYSLLVLANLQKGLKKRIWGRFGPYDAVSLRDDWTSDLYLAIDQLPIVCMVENYRSGLLWRLFMSIPEIQSGLAKAGLERPAFATGFPEAVVTLRKDGYTYKPDAYDIRRHPDSGLYDIPYWVGEADKVSFALIDGDGETVFFRNEQAVAGGNHLLFPQFMPVDNRILDLTMLAGGKEYRLPVRLH